MDTETKIDIFAATAILLFGTLLGGLITYQAVDDRISELEETSDTSQIPSTISEETNLTSIFQEVEQSVVSIEPLEEDAGQGSGFVYDNEGHIITNEHVVRGEESVRVLFTDGTSEEAEVIGSDTDTDLAVLKTEKQVEPLELADSEKINVGENTIAIGNPFGLETSMTTGIISQTERQIQVREGFSIPNILQTDAAINPGNSGGPLMNYEGEVVGVNTAIESSTGTFTGIGFAISSNTVQEVVPELINEGEFEHPWLGIEGVDVDVEIAEEKGMENATGFLVLDVVEGSPAYEAGLIPGQESVELNNREIEIEGGDVIVGIDDQEVNEINDIIGYLLTEKEVDESVELEVLRNGEIEEVTLDLVARPS